MSNARRQTQRANIRESSSSDTNLGLIADNSDAVSFRRLEPMREEIIAAFSLQSVIDVKSMKDIITKIKSSKDDYIKELSRVSNAPSNVQSQFADAIPIDFRGERGKKASLAITLYELHQLTLQISVDSTAWLTITEVLKPPLVEICNAYSKAFSAASEALDDKFKLKGMKLSILEEQRKYIQNGHVPVDPSEGKCIHCGHSAVDEPNTNTNVLAYNATMKQRHDTQERVDKEKWDRGDQVLNNNGTVMKEGQKRPFRGLKELRQECHCREMGCLTTDDEVPKDQCLIQCIDVKTGKRYGFDENGDCLCPLCGCNCRRAWSVRFDFCSLMFPHIRSSNSF